MKNLVIVSTLVSLVLMGIIYTYVGDIIGDDIVNILVMLAAVAILAISAGVSLKYVNQMKNDTASGQLADENWDGIQEYKNELPIGWAISFLGTIVWSFWYWTMGYPVNAYSQIGEYNQEVTEYQTKFESKWADADESTLKAMGESLFLVQCAPCHSETADGMDGKAADLTKRLDEKSVLFVIENGSEIGLIDGQTMPSYSWLPAQDKNDIAQYVADGFVGSTGSKAYAENCSACHGADGKGMDYVAPNIRHFTPSLVSSVLKHGKQGNIGYMPSFRGRFSDIQEKAVGTYILSLSQ